MWSSQLQRRLLKFVLKRALGHYLHANTLSLDQVVDVQLARGEVELRNLALNVDALQHNALPVAVLDGSVASIRIHVPWSNLLSPSARCTLHIDSLSITVVPLSALAPDASVHEHQSGSPMASSIHVASDFLRQQQVTANNTNPTTQDESAPEDSVEGLQVLASLIDTILSRLLITASNTHIHILSSVDPTLHAPSLDIHFPSLSFQDETPILNTASSTSASSFLPVIKAIKLNGLEMFILTPFTKSNHVDDDDLFDAVFHSMSDMTQSIYQELKKELKKTTGKEKYSIPDVTLFRNCNSSHMFRIRSFKIMEIPSEPESWIRFKMKHEPATSTTDIEGVLPAVFAFLPPDALETVLKIAKALLSSIDIVQQESDDSDDLYEPSPPKKMSPSTADSTYTATSSTFMSAFSHFGPTESSLFDSNQSSDRAHSNPEPFQQVTSPENQLHWKFQIKNIELYVPHQNLGDDFDSHVWFHCLKTIYEQKRHGMDGDDEEFAKKFGHDHLKIALSHCLAQSERGDLSKDRVSITIRNVDVLEWLTSSTRGVTKDSTLNVPTEAYIAHVFAHEPNADTTIVGSWFQKPSDSTTMDLTIFFDSYVLYGTKYRELTIKMSSLHVHYDLWMWDRLRHLVTVLGTASSVPVRQVRFAPNNKTIFSWKINIPYVRAILFCPDMSNVTDTMLHNISRIQNCIRREAIVIELKNMYAKSSGPNVQVESSGINSEGEHVLILSTSVRQSLALADGQDEVLKVSFNSQKQNTKIQLFSTSNTPNFPITASENQKFQNHILSTAFVSLELRTKKVHVTFEKMHYDMLQLVLNELTLWQPEGYTPTTPSSVTPLVASFVCQFDCESINIVLESAGLNYCAVVDHPICLIASQVDGKPGASYIYLECASLRLIDSDNLVSITSSELPVISPRLVMHSSSCENSTAETREVCVDVFLSSLTWSYRMGSPIMKQLINFFSTEPPEMVYPYSNRYTRLTLSFDNVSISYKPLNISEQVVLAITKAEVTTNIVPTISTTAYTVTIHQGKMLLRKREAEDSNQRIASSIQDLWNSRGYCDILTVNEIGLDIKSTDENDESEAPFFTIEISNKTCTLETCADSFESFRKVVGYYFSSGDLTNDSKKSSLEETNLSDDGSSVYEDILNDVEQNEFGYHTFSSEKIHVLSGDNESSNMNLLDSIQDNMIEDYYDTNVALKRSIIPQTEKSWEEVEEADIIPSTQTTTPHPKSKTRWNNLNNGGGSSDEKIIFGLENAPEDCIRSFNEDLNIMDDYFSLPTGLKKGYLLPDDFPASMYRIRVKDANIRWKLYQGRDWPSNEQDFPLSPSSPWSTVDKDDFSDSMFDETMQLFERETVPAQKPIGRGDHVDAIFQNLNVEYDLFALTEQFASRLVVLVENLEIIDDVQTSVWKKFLTSLKPDFGDLERERESRSNMINFEWVKVRPDATKDIVESRLKLRILPLRLHVDQDTLNCIIEFFSFKSFGDIEDPSTGENQQQREPYFQQVVIDPIYVVADYKPKRLDFSNLRRGNLVELVNLFRLDGAEMTLRDLRLNGITGWGRLFEEIGQAWVPYITQTQIPGVVSGVMPVRPLVNIGSGMANLVLLPLEQYKKDGRVFRGLQKGVQKFARIAALETLKLGTKLAVGTQIILEQADEIFDPSAVSVGQKLPTSLSRYSEQPKTLVEGLERGYDSLHRNVSQAVKTVFAVPMEVYEQSGSTPGAVKAVIRAVPVAVIRPLIGTSEALQKTLLGLRNDLDPNKRIQSADKYKSRKQ